MRKHLGILMLVVLVATTGCVGMTEYESPEPFVDNETLTETGFQLSDQEEIVLNQSIKVTDVRVVSKINSYDRQNPTNQSISFPPSRYLVVSTPSVAPAGFQLNPIILDPTDSTFERLENRADSSIELGDKTGEFNVSHVNEGNVTVEKYEGSLDIEEVGASFDAVVYSTIIETENSVLVIIASYPEQAGDQEESIIKMIENTTSLKS